MSPENPAAEADKWSRSDPLERKAGGDLETGEEYAPEDADERDGGGGWLRGLGIGLEGLVESELVARAQDDDFAAYNRLIKLYYPKLWAMARKFARSDFEADDLFDQADERAWRHIKKFRGDSAFTSWFYEVLRSIYCNEASKAAKKPLDQAKPIETLTDPECVDEGLCDGSGNGLGADDMENLKADLREAVKSEILTPRQYQLIKGHYFEGVPIKEIAQMLGIRADHANVEISRARNQLRKRFNG